MTRVAPTTVFFVRHGETIWHEENRYAGCSDIGLTELGARQGEQLGVWAATARLDQIVTSDLSRAILTAAPSAASTGLTPWIEPGLREVNFGDGEGRTRAEMAGIFPVDLTDWLAAPADRSLPGGESGAQAITRGLAALEQIVRDNPGGRVLIVGHSTLTRLLICALIGIDPNRYREVFPGIGNGALNEFRLRLGAPGEPLETALVRLNTPTTSTAPSS